MNSEIKYNNLIESLISISKEAGEAILKIYDLDDLGISHKEDNSPLTLADKASNEVICSQLEKLTPTFLSYQRKEKIFLLINVRTGILFG